MTTTRVRSQPRTARKAPRRAERERERAERARPASARRIRAEHERAPGAAERRGRARSAGRAPPPCGASSRADDLVTASESGSRGALRRWRGRSFPEPGSGLAPAAEDEPADREAETERPDREAADGDRLAGAGHALPAAERLALLGREWLAAALLAARPRRRAARRRCRRRARWIPQAILLNYRVSARPDVAGAGPPRLGPARRDASEEPEVEGDLRRLVAESDPELVVASGDLTHRNTPEQHDRAARFLRSLERPLLVVPGNHDIPTLPPGRFTLDLRRVPAGVARDRARLPLGASIVACGLNSVRPWKQQGGALRRDQIERGRAERSPTRRPGRSGSSPSTTTSSARPGAPRKRTIANRSTVLGGLVDAGAELIVSGHVHQSAVGERREFEVLAAARAGPRDDGRHRPRPRPAAAEAPRRGPRPAPLRGGRGLAARPHLRLVAGRERGRAAAGTRSPTAASRAATSRSDRRLEERGRRARRRPREPPTA